MAEPGRRGRPRSEDARLAILSAAARQVTARGYDHLTIEGVAAEAGVGKQTIYRWWTSRSSLVADCLIEGLLLSELFVPEDSGDLRRDVKTWLDNITAFLSRPDNTGLLRSLVAAAADNPDVTARAAERLGLWEMLSDRFGAAVVAGQLPADTPVVELGDALLGTIVLRALRGGDDDPGMTSRLVDLLIPPRPQAPPGVVAAAPQP